MRRYLAMLFILITMIACQLGSLIPRASLPPTPSATISVLPPTNTATPAASQTLIPIPTLTLTSTPSPTPASAYTVEYHPDGPLYVGDLVSISVISPQGISMPGGSVTFTLIEPQEQQLGYALFGDWGIAGRSQATLIWGWDTAGLAAGDYTLQYSIDTLGYTFTDTLTLLPADALPAVQAGARWAQANTVCCVVHYITGTAAERDLPGLLALVDQRAEHATQAMGIEFTEPIVITILPRLMGHGGFTSSEVYVSYLDRNYAANSWEMVVHHEMIHMLDGRLGGDLRPTMLVEGLAVYLSGGHYKPELLLPRAAALLEENTNLFIPLDVLAQDFYAAQHEISYLQAGALVQYLVETYGWELFSSFYRDIHPAPNGSQVDALQAALQAHFGQSLAELEQSFIAYLRLQTDSASWQQDVVLTVSYFDTLRRYQQLLDPSAYFRTAWLLDGRELREKNITADWLRHPNQPANLALETMFISASDALLNGQAGEAQDFLSAINQVLDGVEIGQADPFNANPLAADYLAIATTLQQNGYMLQSVDLSGDTASVLVTAEDMNLIELHLVRQSGSWQIV